MAKVATVPRESERNEQDQRDRQERLGPAPDRHQQNQNGEIGDDVLIRLEREIDLAEARLAVDD